ncbi:MAG: hypothetical protein SPI25_02750 [Dialister sp.]|nr:hypothetical protein [Dialister sp.]
MKEIERMYGERGLAYLPTYEKAKAVLSVYRHVVWAIKARSGMMLCEAVASYGKDPDSALTFLETFAPEQTKNDFQARVTHLFETRWLIDLINQAMEKIGEYPMHGATYRTIIYHYFLAEEKETDEGLMRRLHLERTCYYQKKKEAIALIGVAVWGYALPTLLHELKEEQQENKVRTLCEPEVNVR